MSGAGPVRVGVVSDTHGLLRPEVLLALRGVDHLIHAGDVGTPEILPRLAAAAPLTAVRGNVDRGTWGRRLPETAEVELGGVWFHVLHALDDLDLDPAGAGFGVVVHGHTHRPSVERRRGVVYLNPGSAGPRRFHLPVTVARVTISGGAVRVRIVPLAADGLSARGDGAP